MDLYPFMNLKYYMSCNSVAVLILDLYLLWFMSPYGSMGQGPGPRAGRSGGSGGSGESGGSGCSGGSGGSSGSGGPGSPGGSGRVGRRAGRAVKSRLPGATWGHLRLPSENASSSQCISVDLYAFVYGCVLIYIDV
jgi:hypothetical protein